MQIKEIVEQSIATSTLQIVKVSKNDASEKIVNVVSFESSILPKEGEIAILPMVGIIKYSNNKYRDALVIFSTKERDLPHMAMVMDDFGNTKETVYKVELVEIREKHQFIFKIEKKLILKMIASNNHNELFRFKIED